MNSREQPSIVDFKFLGGRDSVSKFLGGKLTIKNKYAINHNKPVLLCERIDKCD